MHGSLCVMPFQNLDTLRHSAIPSSKCDVSGLTRCVHECHVTDTLFLAYQEKYVDFGVSRNVRPLVLYSTVVHGNLFSNRDHKIKSYKDLRVRNKGRRTYDQCTL